MNYKKHITLEKDNIFEQLENLNGKQCYDKFGLKRDESQTKTVKFENGYTVDLKMCVCDEEYTTFAEGILFDETGKQVSLSEPIDSIVGEWYFEDNNNNTYTILVESDNYYKYTYTLNAETGLLTVWEDDKVLSTVEGVSPDMAEEIFKEDVFNIAGVEL